MKELFSFKVKNGEEEYRFILKKPTRTEAEEVEIFNASTLSYLMNAGVQTRAAVDKYYLDNSDGVMPKQDEKQIIKLRKELALKEEQLLQSSLKDKDVKENLLQEIYDISDKIRSYNSYYSEIYDNTAEIKARNKTIDYCLLHFSYLQKGKGPVEPLFEGDDDNLKERVNLKYASYDAVLEKEDAAFYKRNIDKLIFLFTLWYMDAADKAKDFEKLLNENFTREEDQEEAKQTEELDKKESEAPAKEAKADKVEEKPE